MKRTMGIALAAAMLLPLATDAGHGKRNGHNMNIQTTSKAGIARSCSEIKVEIDKRPAMRAEDRAVVDGSAALEVTAARNGGVSVIGGNGRDFVVRTCKAALTQAGLDSIRTLRNGNAFTASAESDEPTAVFFIVEAPRGSTLAVSATNGPVEVAEVDANVTASAVNGPVSLSDVRGTINATTKNGPIDLKRGSGDVRLSAKNGPVSVDLDGTGWVGSGLNASSKNGPLSLRIPETYTTGVIVETSGHSPMSCRAKACRQASWIEDDDTKQIAFGGATALVRLSNVNGPVSID